MIKADMINRGATVIDAGINWVEGKMVGDVDFDGVKEVASMITPVPGGVGPVTRVMLFRNLLKAGK
jgi:methylenetetrahydrofolate dehydrogenase (NADP+)/methenyltetrahydrofolate cyclohydrolase